MLDDAAWVKTGYAKGVPMGGDLPRRQGQGADLHRLGVEGPDLRQPRPHPDRQGLEQERPELREGLRRGLVRRSQAGQVVRHRAAVGNTVDVANATYTNTIGAVELKKVWTDPEFDPSLDAFYYARC